MAFVFDSRLSDSPLIETIWRTQSDSEPGGSFISAAATHSELVVTKQYGQTWLTVRGPETHATPSPIPENAEFFGIVFKHGTFMPQLPAKNLVDGSINLPEGAGKTFWLHGSTWQFPDFENADTFINRLVRQELLVHDPIIEAVLQNRLPDLTPRSLRRHFIQATGLTHGAIVQIQRAHHAAALLQYGIPILDAVYLAGYSDQPHMTRSLKYFTGQTPAQIARFGTPSPVSNLEMAGSSPTAGTSPLLQDVNLEIA